MKRIFAFVFISGVACATLFAQAADKAEIKRIDAYCKSVDKVVQKSKTPELIFADVSEDTAGVKSKWRKFSNEKALEDFRERSETYTIAYVWRRGGKPAVVNFTLFSESGDWAKYVYSYYRADGTLARVESELRTFYGHYIAISRQYFDAKGKPIQSSVRYLDLPTKKPKKPDPGFVSDNPIWEEANYFKRASRLPFAYLLKSK